MDPLIKLLGSWAGELNAGSVVLRILLSVFLSAVIGCERANKRHSAGLRTFIIICLASACAMLLDEFLMSSGKTGFPFVSAAAVIAVAIISTYSILYSARSQIKGLTTAAGLWACGILGLTAGAGYYTVSLCMFVALISCLSALPTLEIYLKNRSNHFEIHLELRDRHDLAEFLTILRKLGLTIDDIESNPAYTNSGLGVYSISLTITGEEIKKYKTHKEIIDALSTIEYVSFVEEIR